MRYLIGAGTYAASDDGIGLRVVDYIVENGLEEGFRAVGLASGGLGLLTYLDRNTEEILLVDCAKFGGAPGEHLFFKPEDVRTRKDLAGLSTHETDALRVLDLVRGLGYAIPPVTILAIEPETVRPGIGLSETLALRLPAYVEAALSHFRGALPATG